MQLKTSVVSLRDIFSFSTSSASISNLELQELNSFYIKKKE